MTDEEAALAIAHLCTDLHRGLGLDEEDDYAIALIGTAMAKAYRLGQSSAKEERDEQRTNSKG